MTTAQETDASSLRDEHRALIAERAAAAQGARSPFVDVAVVLFAVAIPLFALLAVTVGRVVPGAWGAIALSALMPAGIAAWKAYERRDRVEAPRRDALDAPDARVRRAGRLLREAEAAEA